MKKKVAVILAAVVIFVGMPLQEYHGIDYEPLPPPTGADFSPYVMTVPVKSPLETGEITSSFGWRIHPIENGIDFHTGIDLACAEGSRITAIWNGTVETASYHESYGNYIRINHYNGFTSLYAHCKQLLVSTGDEVLAGEKIALAGQTGDATGPHLHLEICMEGTRLDPAYIPCIQQYGLEEDS